MQWVRVRVYAWACTFRSLLRGTWCSLSPNVIIDCKSKKKKKKKSKACLRLQESSTALKNKGDRWQYIKFYAIEKKKKIN